MKKITKKILAILLVVLLTVSLTACGGGDGKSEGGKSGGESEKVTFDGTYQYNPPVDNYYIEWKSYGADGTELEGSTVYARIGTGHTTAFVGEGVYHASDEQEKYYSRAWDGEWMIDPGYSYSEWKSDYDEFGADLGECDSFEDVFMKYFRAYGFDDDEGKLAEYFVGTEEVAGVNCWVFDSKGLNAIYGKYWIDPSNGCCLKCQDTENGEGEYSMVVKYDLNYTEWTDNLAPSSYEGIQ